MSLQIVTVPCLQDNYAYLLRDEATGAVGLIDAPEAAPIEAALAERGWELGLILITHHHRDHIDGVDRLRSKYGVRVVGAAADRERLPGLDEAVSEGDVVELGGSKAEVFDVSGHTIGHIAYYFADDAALFSADSLMVMGCGRLFEGDADRMWASLSKLAALPDATQVYSGHEYARSNAKFALSVDGDNPDLVARSGEIDAMRERGAPTVPATLELEKRTNPFLRAANPEFKAAHGLSGLSDAQVFGEMRRRKDAF